MTDERPILQYSSICTRSVCGLDLQEDDKQVRVLFPVMPRWVFLIPLANSGYIGFYLLFVAIRSLVDVWQIRGIGFHFAEWMAEDGNWSITRGVLSISLAVLCYVAFRTWTRERSVLAATRNGLLWSCLPLFGRRTKWWPVQSISGIELRRSWRHVAIRGSSEFLHIRLVDGQTQRFYLYSDSRRLPHTIAERLATTLGRPLKGVPRRRRVSRSTKQFLSVAAWSFPTQDPP